MSSAVVYVFLLDNIVGFNRALNDTILSHSPDSHNEFTPVIRKCDVETSEHILSVVSKGLDIEVVPTFKNIERQSVAHDVHESIHEGSQENIYNALLETSLPEAENEEFFEKPDDFGNNDLYHISPEIHPHINNTEYYNKENLTNATEEVKNDTKLEFPKSAPFLVAIFETLSNVTAQTCAGTLIAPSWVLTAANCVNILKDLYGDSTNTTDQPMYTVVAGATDPLTDGTTHNVTAVLQHLRPSGGCSRNHKSIDTDISTYLAMMKIEPEFDIPMMPLVEEKVKKGDVMIYGWVLAKNASGLDSLSLMTMSARILSSAECQAMYSYNNNDIICLYNTDKGKNITQISSGGPVLLVQDGVIKMLAVVQSDEHVFIAYPTYVQVDWIKTIINNDE